MTDKIYIFDTTLRDGEQSPGASMNLEEKVQIAEILEEMNVDIIEAGFPIASNGDFESVQEISKNIKNSTIAGLARAKLADIDRAWEAVKHAESPRIHTFIATSPVHMKYKLKKNENEVLEAIKQTVTYARNLCPNIEWSCEDAGRSEINFLFKCIELAIECGATTINIPDTVGYTLPDEFGKIFKEVKNNVKNIDKVIDIDQSPIGRTPRSNPATYTGAFGPIRDWFTNLPESKTRGYKPGRFSFNVKGGRCEACEGDGVITYEMHFLPDVYIACDDCKGSRYNRETLEIKFKDKNISDILNMTVDEGCDFFENIPSIRSKLLTLKKVGLGYIKIGQQATTLSGGEAQRIKLAKELSKRSTGRTMYILDEPTTGLHSHDIKKLLEILQTFVGLGNTVIVIEHNLDVIKTADWIVDMGPEGGVKGGEIIAEGNPEKISQCENSYTGNFLKEMLNKKFKKIA